jgi:hypothetical protein
MVLTGTAAANPKKEGTLWLWEIKTGRPLGPPLVHQSTVSVLAVSPDGKSVLTGTLDKTARRCLLPVPIGGDVQRIKVWTRVFTGMDLDEHDAAQVLEPGDWDKYRQRLRELGGPPQR